MLASVATCIILANEPQNFCLIDPIINVNPTVPPLLLQPQSCVFSSCECFLGFVNVPHTRTHTHTLPHTHTHTERTLISSFIQLLLSTSSFLSHTPQYAHGPRPQHEMAAKSEDTFCGNSDGDGSSDGGSGSGISSDSDKLRPTSALSLQTWLWVGVLDCKILCIQSNFILAPIVMLIRF